MWAWARFDFGLTLDEFADLTPGGFQALARRRAAGIKHLRYANALTASAVYNVNRSKADDPLIRPFDFVMDDEQAERREQKRRFTAYVHKALGHLPSGTTMEKTLSVRLKVIEDLRASGCADPEAFVNGIYPSLKQ